MIESSIESAMSTDRGSELLSAVAMGNSQYSIKAASHQNVIIPITSQRQPKTSRTRAQNGPDPGLSYQNDKARAAGFDEQYPVLELFKGPISRLLPLQDTTLTASCTSISY